MWDEKTTTQTEELLGVDRKDSHQSIMEAALDLASKDMGALVALRNQQLKVGAVAPRDVQQSGVDLGKMSLPCTCVSGTL